MSFCLYWRAASARLLPLMNISPGATARKEKGSTEADDAARFSGETFYLSIKCFLLWCGPFSSSFCLYWRAASARLLPSLNISPDATTRKENWSTEDDDVARFSGETFYLSIKCFLLWCSPFSSSFCLYWRAASARLLPLLNISPDATARKEKGSTEANDAARFSGETSYLSIKCFLLWYAHVPFSSFFCFYWRAASSRLFPCWIILILFYNLLSKSFYLNS